MLTNSSSVKGKWNSGLPLANVFTDPRVRVLFEEGFVVIKEKGRLDEKLRACSEEIANIICDLCPGICLDPNDVLTFWGTFMTSSDENVSDVVVHTIEVEDRRGVVQEGSSHSSSSSTTIVQVVRTSFSSY